MDSTLYHLINRLCFFGLSATSQRYFSLKTNQPSTISQQQYFSLNTKYFSLGTSHQLTAKRTSCLYKKLVKSGLLIRQWNLAEQISVT
jgi:hypothetical protein